MYGIIVLVDNFGPAIRLVLYGIRDSIVISIFTPLASLYYAKHTRRASHTLEVVPALFVVSSSRNRFRSYGNCHGAGRD